MVLAISSTPHGVVLVDEIENGIHYSVLGKVWRAVDLAARRFDVQVVATTHSFECMQAAHDALDNGLLFHRIDGDDEGGNRCVTFEAEELATAISHGLEVR